MLGRQAKRGRLAGGERIIHGEALVSLTAGSRLGRYEIVSRLGAGGMGEVYRARDTRLDRTVALKILAAEFASEPKARARFEREARAISALDHPYICTLYDVGEQDGQAYLVMEYLSGETLAERLKKGLLPLQHALEVAMQVAEALAAAHRQGIVHRDLKPGNVMLTKAGAKLLDFGLARLTGHGERPVVEDLASSPTLAAPLTGRRTILGTVPYMAPEQLEGKPADARTDLWALGALVYEMVTGRRAFEGRSQLSLIAAIAERNPPPVSSLQPLLPAALDHVVQKCLEKDPERRWQSAADLRDELHWISSSASAAAVPRAVPSRWRWQRLMVPALAAALALSLTVLAAVGYRGRAPTSATRVTRLLLSVPEGKIPFATAPQIAISPDGRELVYAARHQGVTRLYLRPMDQFHASSIRGTEGASSPFVSPDGGWVAFFADNRLKKVSLRGGDPLTLCELEPGFIRTGTWSREGWIVFSNSASEGLQRVPAGGGAVEGLGKPDVTHGEVAMILPEVIPGGEHLLFTSMRAGLGYGRHPIGLLSLKTKARQILTGDVTMARLLDDGHVVGWNRGSLFAFPFNRSKSPALGRGSRVLEGVGGGTIRRTGAFSLSAFGSLVYLVDGAQRGLTRFQWLDRHGIAQPLAIPENRIEFPALSPDGGSVAYVCDEGGRDVHVWVLDLKRGSMARVTQEGENHAPIWTPDGRWLIFSSSREGVDSNLYRQRADGTGKAEVLLNSPYHQDPGSVTPDGKTLVYSEFSSEGSWDVWALSLEGQPQPRPVVSTKANENDPMLSPDGRWLAYASTESGSYEVYVQPFPEGSRRWQISSGGGREPLWSADGRELFFRAGDAVMAVRIATTPEFQASKGQLLFSGRLQRTGGFGHPGYAVSRDGRRFLMLEPVSKEEPAATEVRVVLNWAAEVKQQMRSQGPVQ